MLTFRPMCDDDLSRVLGVERASYEFPWTLETFRDCLRVEYSCWVGELGSEIVAHGIMSVAVGECHVFNLCVHPAHQRRGHGREMLRHLMALAVGQGAETAFLEVRASNASAKELYASEGFCEIGLRRRYYPARQGREDAAVLARQLMGLDSGHQVA
ncbi:ribosomal-protein-alanine acetyltransferase [Thiorhodococcus drewsii AZ1]|uniref:[Ribosomal protein bS18]-alanine N-acetyltransferase n=1 Tax=Thiorhodococcus drewsii AZ1 TaxID=765913 RepID=G2E2H8_9GAMM|nr:ribosomal protein S18-alanine N-acetyltransferase [Thiorhodococcus drewsii]EGV30778.1 ribosomal-protein-alanine acetyltransferase [Thiorhodococcus drewsii AZ1]